MNSEGGGVGGGAVLIAVSLGLIVRFGVLTLGLLVVLPLPLFALRFLREPPSGKVDGEWGIVNGVVDGDSSSFILIAVMRRYLSVPQKYLDEREEMEKFAFVILTIPL